MTFIGIDLGTSFIKGALLNPDTLRIEHVRRLPFPAPLPGLPDLFREFNPQAILGVVQSLLDELIPIAGECEGLLLCSQMHCLVLTGEQGEPHSNLITWQDQRVLMPHPSGKGTYFEVMAERIGAEAIRQLGNELRPGLPIGTLFWLAEQGASVSRWIPASLPDFVVANLCGAAPVTDITHGMSHGALNLETLEWHSEVISSLGLESLRWPEVQPQGAVVGHLPVGARRVPCYTPVGDFQSALVGALLQTDELSLNISTGSQVSLLLPRAEFGNYQTRPFFDGRFLATVTHIPAGRSLNSLVGLLTELAGSQNIELFDPWPYIARAAAGAQTGDLRVNLAFFNSSCGDQGEITHIREPELTVGRLFRAAFENMADNYYHKALQISPEKAWNRLVFSGGLAQKIDILRSVICDRFQVGWRMAPSQEDTLLGLLALGLVFTGRLPSVGDATALLLEKYQE